jgi:hypothetical protein
MSVELVLWLFSFASVMALVGLTAYQASSASCSLKLSSLIPLFVQDLAQNSPNSSPIWASADLFWGNLKIIYAGFPVNNVVLVIFPYLLVGQL